MAPRRELETVMRRFRDEQGSEWEAVVGRESWGTFVLLFTAVGGTEVRQAQLSAEGALEAEQELEALSTGELRERLIRSRPWGE